MNRETFDQLFGKAKDLLQPTPIRMENYGNSAVKVLGMFHAFLKWKDNVYKQLFYVTDCDRSPNLLSHDACYTLGVLKPCYTVEKQPGISENSTHSTQSQVAPIHASKSDTKVGNSFLHQKMKGTVKKLSNNSTNHSISKEQLQGGPLTKQLQMQPNAKPTRHAPRKVPIHLQEAFHEEIRNLEALGILD